MEKSDTQLQENLTLEDVLDMRNKLDHELRHLHEAQLTLNQESDEADAKKLMERVCQLQSELASKSAAHSLCELRLKRLEMGKVLCEDVLFKEEKDEFHQQMVQNCQEKLELASQVSRIEKENNNLQEKLDEQKLKISSLNAENTVLLKKIKENQEKQSLPPEIKRNKAYKRLKRKLEIHQMTVAIQKNIIQRLVTGLGLDLDEDENLRICVEKCGEPT